VLRPKTSWKKFEGEWALVTGASMGTTSTQSTIFILLSLFNNFPMVHVAFTGIGHEIARGLASRGINVIVSARTESKLKEVVQELKEKYHIEAEYIAADLVRELDDKATLQRFEALFEKRKISVLVNNLGGPLIDMMNFVDIPPEQFKLINNMNSGSTFILTQMALKRMLPRHKGRIINCGSMSSYGSPWLLPYGSEKKKLEAFAESMFMELDGSGVQVQTALIAATFSEAIAAYNGISSALGKTIHRNSR
jgi:uncharacterized protein